MRALHEPRPRRWRAAAVALVGLAGIAALLATSPPPPARGWLEIAPQAVCAQDEVTLTWHLYDGSDAPAPRDVRIISDPADAFDPPLDDSVLTVGSGTRVSSVRATAYVTMRSDAGAFAAFDVTGVTVMLCDELGRQFPDASDARVEALAVEPGGATLVAVLRSTGWSRVVRLDPELGVLGEFRLPLRIRGLVVEPGGAMVAVGSPLGPNDAAILAVDAEGNERWRDRAGADDPAATLVTVAAVALDPDGDLVVAGSARTADGFVEAFVRRYASDGTLRWERRVAAEGPDAADVRGAAVAVAPDGTVGVSGWTAGEVAAPVTGVADAFLVTFDRAGVRAWAHQAPGRIDAGSLAVDADGRWLLVADELIALEPDGTVAWTLAAPAAALLTHVAVTASGSVVSVYRQVVTIDLPGTAGSTFLDILLRRVDRAGVVTRAWRVGSHRDERGQALTAWPWLGPEAMVLGGVTDGDLLVPRERGQPEPFVLVSLD